GNGGGGRVVWSRGDFARAPKNSLTTAPIMASVVQARNAVNMNGALFGTRSFQNTCHSVAAQLRISSRLRGSTSRSPRSVPMNVGKKVMRAAIATFEPGPIPNQTMASGARATIGTDDEATA